jgi:hypothetical protein
MLSIIMMMRIKKEMIIQVLKLFLDLLLELLHAYLNNHRNKNHAGQNVVTVVTINQHNLLLNQYHMLQVMPLEEQSNMLPKNWKIELKQEKLKEKLKLELLKSMPNSKKRRKKMTKEKT